jgi:hypothetical protein
MADTNLLMQVKSAQMPSYLDSLQRASATKNEMMRTQAMQQEMDNQSKLDQLYRESGGDINKMVASPDIGFNAGMAMRGAIGEQKKLEAQAGTEQAKQDKLRIQSGLEKLNYGSQLLQGATPENWQQIRQEFNAVTGGDIGEQYDPDKVQSYLSQGLTIKDAMANEWKQKGYDLDMMQFGEQQRHNRTSEGISYMNAQNRADGGGAEYKLPVGYKMRPDGAGLEPIPGGPADIKVQSQTAKLNAQQTKDITALENADAAASNTIALIDQVRNHPGKSSAVGLSSIANVAAIPGSPRQDFLAKLDQLKGQQFLQAFQSLKGGGAITEVEGKKAEQAIANANTAQSEEQFDSAMNDFAKIIADGQSRVQKRMTQYNADSESLSMGSTPRQPALSPADQQAAAWANANPNDPRSAAIRQKLGL